MRLELCHRYGLALLGLMGCLSFRVALAREMKLETPPSSFDASTTYLSDLQPFAPQRGTGLPQPTVQKDKGFLGQPIRLRGQTFAKGLGCAANTVIVPI